jgi:ribosomal protein L37E
MYSLRDIGGTRMVNYRESTACKECGRSTYWVRFGVCEDCENSQYDDEEYDRD